jgi:hypothetical protein
METGVTVRQLLVFIALLPWSVAGQDVTRPPGVLQASATSALATSLQEAAAHAKHVWRDTAPTNPDGTVNAYIEIARGDRRKWELDMGANARTIDRMIPTDVGGYPVNYGFVPQTVSYDGDPFETGVRTAAARRSVRPRRDRRRDVHGGREGA